MPLVIYDNGLLHDTKSPTIKRQSRYIGFYQNLKLGTGLSIQIRKSKIQNAPIENLNLSTNMTHNKNAHLNILEFRFGRLNW
uniref:PRO2049 n=1 Tax=Homo sapiens TaxID=9606 RepID=Q9P1F0_HUMAN|nr:PRO2049 [Homo sapiens]